MLPASGNRPSASRARVRSLSTLLVCSSNLVVPELPKEVPEHHQTPMHPHSPPTSVVRLKQERTSQRLAPAQLLFVASAAASPLLEDHVFHAADLVVSAEVARDSASKVPRALVVVVNSAVVCPEAVEASLAVAALVVGVEEGPPDPVVKVKREATTAARVATRSA